jgi:hypothetical protein
MVPRRFIWAGTLAMTVALSGAAAQELTVPHALDMLDGSTQAIKSFDVRAERTMRYLIKYETKGEGKRLTVTSGRKLGAGEEPIVQRQYSRQRYDRGKGRFEFLDGPGGTPVNVIVYDPEVEKTWNADSAAGIIRPPSVIVGGDGGEYLEACRGLYGRVPLLRCLRQRKHVTIRSAGPGGAHVVLEAQPEPTNIAIDFPTWGVRVTLDASRGFIPLIVERFEIIDNKPVTTARRTVTEVKDLGRGLWAPLRVVTQHFDIAPQRPTFGEVSSEVELVVDPGTSSWNTPIAEAAFQLAYPVGANITDMFRDVTYVTGKPDTGKNLKDLAAHAVNTVPMSKETPTEDLTPKSYYGWWAGGAGLLAVAVLGAIFYVRWRKPE